MMNYSEFCFFSPSANYIIDFLNLDDTTAIDGETLKEVRQQFPDAKRIESDKALLLTGYVF